MDRDTFRRFLFMHLVGWMLHPGYQREGASAPSLDEVVRLVDRATEVFYAGLG